MAKPYIPRKHNKFNAWQKQLVKELLTDPAKKKTVPFPPAPGAPPANWQKWDIPQNSMQELLDAQAGYQPTYDAWSDKDARSDAIRKAHIKARKVYEKFLRLFVARWLRSNKKVNKAAKAALGLTVPDEVLTPVKAKDHGPRLSIDKITRFMHTIRVADPERPETKAMPKGHKVMLERFIGPAGLQAKDMKWSIYRISGRFLIRSEFTDKDKGMVAYYRAFYISNRGELSPSGAMIEMGIV